MYVKKQKFSSVNEEINAMKSQEVNFQKSQKLARLSGWEFEQADKSRVRRVRNPLLILNE